MTLELFSKWLVNMDSNVAGQERMVLLLLYNCTSHLVVPPLLLYCSCAAPNVTFRVQPLDLSIVQNFKLCYHNQMVGGLLLDLDQPAIALPGTKLPLHMADEMVRVVWMEVKRQP